MSGDPLGILTPKKQTSNNDPLGILTTPKKEQPTVPTFMDVAGQTQQTIQTAKQNVPKPVYEKPKPTTGEKVGDIMGKYGITPPMTEQQSVVQYGGKIGESLIKQRDEAIENTIQYRNNKLGIKTDTSSVKYKNDVKKLRDQFNEGEFVKAEGKNGKQYVVPGAGFWESAGMALAESFKAPVQAWKINTLEGKDLADYLDRLQRDEPFLPQKKPSGVAGAFGETAGGFPKFAAIMSAGNAIAPMMGTGLVGAEAEFVSTAMYTRDLYQRNLQKLLDEGIPVEEARLQAADKAKKDAPVIAMPDAAMAVGLGVNLNPTRQVAAETFKKLLVKEAAHATKIGLAGGGAELAKVGTEVAMGYDVTPNEALERFADATFEWATMDAMFKVLPLMRKMPGALKASYKEYLRTIPREVIEQQAAEKNVPIEEIDAELNSYEAARSKVADIVPEESVSTFAGLTEKQDKLKSEISELESKKAVTPEGLHPQIEKEIEVRKSEIESINKQIADIAEKGDAEKIDIDRRTGEPELATVIMPEEINRPEVTTTTPKENKPETKKSSTTIILPKREETTITEPTPQVETAIPVTEQKEIPTQPQVVAEETITPNEQEITVSKEPLPTEQQTTVSESEATPITETPKVEEGGVGALANKTFITHKNEVVSGNKLADAVNKVADNMVESAKKKRKEHYASHITEKQKDAILAKDLKYAEEVRQGEHLNNLTIAQRINYELTGESVPILPKEQAKTTPAKSKVESKEVTTQQPDITNEINKQIKQSQKWEQEMSNALDEYSNPKNEAQEKEATKKINKIREERRKRDIELFKNNIEDENYNEVHDAILTGEDGVSQIPKGYTATVIDSYYEPILGRNHTIVSVKNNKGQTFYIDVNTYRTVEIGKVYDSKITEPTTTQPIVEEVKSGAVGVGNWRGKYKEADAYRKSDILRAIAEVSKSDKELSDVLDMLVKGAPNESNVAWEVANNPNSSKETFKKAVSNKALIKSTTDENIQSLREKRFGKEGSVSKGVKTETVTEKTKTDLGTKARDLAAKVRSGEKQVLPDWLQASLPKGTKKQGIDINEAFAKALETFADVYDTTKDFAQAVEQGFKNIKDWFDENKISYNEAELKEKFAQDRQGEIPTESQPPPPSEPPVSEQGEGKGGRTDERRFSKQMLETEDLVPEAKEGVKETLEYAVQTNAMSIQEASEILKKVGLDEGVALVMDRNNDMNGGVRVVMAQAIIKSYNELVKNAPDQATKDFYLDKVIQVAKNVTDKLATDPGQMIQAFSLWSTLTPEAQLRYSTKEVGEIGKARKEKQKKNINNIGNKFKKANEEAAEEVFNDPEVKNTINKNDSERAKKARVKIAKARQRRENILKKYKGQKGKNLFSTGVPGLSPEGIEFVGEVALTYIQEGIANVELLVEKIKQNLKEVSGKDVPDELTEQITQIADDKLNRSDERLIGKELKEQKLSINDIVKQHYTVAEKAKKSLADKLVEKAGLTGEEAADLAAKVEAAFDRIATRKKKRILFQEKARFDRIKNGMKGANTVDPKTLQGEMIRYSNLGAFENDAFADMIAEKLGTGKLTPQEAQRIIDLSEKVQNAPEGSPKNDATEDLLAYRANLKGTNWAEIAQGAWYANVLSGYKTHEKNIVSTFFNVVGELSAQSLKNPTEAPFILYGFLKGARRGGLEGIHTLVTGRSPIHVKKVETPNVLERKEFKGGYFNPANWLKFVTRAMVAEDVLMFQGLKEARAYQLALREAKKYGAKKGEIWKAVDELLLNTKQRYDEALAQAKSEGLASTIDIKRRVYELMEASRPVPMTEDAYGFAAEGTFNHETQGTLGAMSNAIAAFVDMPIGGAQPLRFIVPFTRIITNVVNQALNYTPVGLVRAARGVRGFRSFENYAYAKSAYVKLTPEQRKTIIAKASLGIGLAAALYALSKIKDEDDEPLIEITGGGTGDYKKDQQLREAGWQEYSIKVGDTYWSYKLTPLIFMLGFFGNMNDKEKYAKTEDDATTLKQMELAMWRNFNLVGELSWINTAGTLLGALQEGAKNKEDITRSLEQSMKGFLVPQAYTQAAQEVQKIFNMPQKRVENAWQNMIQDIPIARNSLNDKINVLGDPIIRDVDVINSEVTPDPVLKFLLDNNGWIAPVNKNSMIVYKNGIERDITEDEYYEFSKVRGQLVKQKIQKLMQSNLYKVDEFKVKTLSKGTPEYKRKLQSELSKIAQEATDEAKNKLMPKDLYIEITEEVSSSIENILNTR